MAVGFVLTMYLGSFVERRALVSAIDTGAIAAEIGVHGRLTPENLDRGLDDEQVRTLDEALRTESTSGIRRLKIFNRRGRGLPALRRDRPGGRAGHEGAERHRRRRPVPGLGLLLPIVRAASMRLERTSEENAHLALHDALTGLPNRLLAFDRVQQAIDTARRAGHSVAVAFIDLDRFKEVNDTLGHQHGDDLLCEVAQRLRSMLRAEDTVARLGGDEFAVVLPRTSGEEAAVAVVRKAMESLNRPVLLDQLAVDVQASAGVANFPGHGDDAEALLRRADIAMYRAKATRGGVCVYEPALDDANGERLILLGELRDAIAADELNAVYQPKVDVVTGAVVGAEALVRWTHPRHGPIGPDEFVPLAEHTGLIGPLTDWVLRRAITDCRAWVTGGHDFGVAVNLSPLTLHERDLVERVQGVLAEAGLPPRYLTLEITEGAVMVDPDGALATLERLHALEVSVAIDDFGTGYSSLSCLQRLPIDELKIDRAFVTDLGCTQGGSVIVQTAIDLGRNLGLRVVAEGVEELATWRELSQLQCDVAQGYLLSRPVAVDDMLAWVDDGGSANVVTPGLSARVTLG